MVGKITLLKYVITFILFSGLLFAVAAQDKIIAKVGLKENNGLDRSLEYIEIEVQLPLDKLSKEQLFFVAQSEMDNKKIPCQVIEHKIFEKQKIEQIRLLFPVSMQANQVATYYIKEVKKDKPVKSNLSFSGKGFELVIDNSYYRADLTKSDQSEGKNHESGQLRELFLKMGFDVLLSRKGNRMHWGPNFQNMDVEYYKTIAGWERPEKYEFINGPYMIRTMRRDRAPEHDEIMLSANYSFYNDLPYFTFFSSMVIEEDVLLFLLRNDEMTMDSLFTHVAYEKKPAEIVDLAFSERYQALDSEPISNEARWLCFYNVDKGYAFGSIRIKYDITNKQGLPSPTYMPHTKISDGAGGGKYWNRRLIHEHPLLVPVGSRYVEENAYVVFKINKDKKFREIIHWADLIKHPIEVTLLLEDQL